MILEEHKALCTLHPGCLKPNESLSDSQTVPNPHAIAGHLARMRGHKDHSCTNRQQLDQVILFGKTGGKQTQTGYSPTR